MLIITSTFFAVVGAGLGWWKETRLLYRRPGSKWATDTIPAHRISSAVLARRRRRRLMATAEFFVYGALAGVALFWTLQRFVT